MRAILRYFIDSWQKAAAAWNRFWFSPTDPTLVGLLRLLTGLMLLYTHAVWGLELDAFFGPHGWQSAEAVREMQSNQTVFSYWWWVSPDWMIPVHLAGLAILACFTVGLYTRVTSILACIVALSYVHRAPVALFGLDQINVMLTLYLAIGPCGRALSVDRLRTRYRAYRAGIDSNWADVDLSIPPSIGANLSLRLIQVHMCVIYFFAGISKLQGTAWWTGEAMWLAFANQEYQSTDMTWLAQYPWMLNLMTHTTIAWEISFSALIWNRHLRPLVLFVGVLLHVGIGAWMGMWTFGLIMLVGCSSFLPPDSVRTVVGKLLAFRTRPAVTRTDDVTSRGRLWWLSWVKAFDVNDRVQCVDSDGQPRYGTRMTTPFRSSSSAGPANDESEPLRRRRSARRRDPRDVRFFAPKLSADRATKNCVCSSANVLCLDSRQKNGEIVGKYLADRGIRVRVSANLDHALTQYEDSRPDCLIVMAEAYKMHTVEDFLEEATAGSTERLPCITVLSSRQARRADQLLASGMTAVLVQPITLRQLRRQIEESLQIKRETSLQPTPDETSASSP
jgi:CheY-like chemotaxis protein